MSSGYISNSQKQAAAEADMAALQPYDPEELLDAITNATLEGASSFTLKDLVRYQTKHSIEALLRSPLPSHIPEDIARCFTQNTAEYSETIESILSTDSVLCALRQHGEPTLERIKAIRARRTVVVLSFISAPAPIKSILNRPILAHVA